MLSPITTSVGNDTSLKNSNASASAIERTEKASNDFENFLQLLTAQLRNQDPLSPLDSTQFVAQIASFSTVEQLVNVNNRLDAIAASAEGGSLDRYAAWIGKDAEVTDVPVVFNGASMEFRVKPNPDADRVEIVIRDATGAEISRFAGANIDKIQSWNGKIAGGQAVAPGNYYVSAEYFAANNSLGTESASVFLAVEEIRNSANGPIVGLEGGVYRLPEEIAGIRINQ